MSFVREYGLVHNPSNPERFIRIVHWEQHWELMDGDWERFVLRPVQRELMELDVSNPKAYDYAGSVMKWIPVVVTELSLKNWPVATTPLEARDEPEALRRERIRAIRRAIHVDEAKGAAEPPWHNESVRAAA